VRDIDAVSGDVLNVVIRLHRQLEPGLLESVYEALLGARLAGMGYRIARQRLIDIEFEGVQH
jgi:iron complex transport system substrate-binding protein